MDILTPRYAIEVDRAHKWSEAIGQALFYALKTKRKPAIILLTEDALKDARFVRRCSLVCRRYRIRLFVEVVP